MLKTLRTPSLEMPKPKEKSIWINLLNMYAMPMSEGSTKIYNAPEKIMGIEVGDMDGALDSTRQGVVYLSESVSKLYVSGQRVKRSCSVPK